MTRLRSSLYWKLMLAFMSVVLVAVSGVALVARQTTSSEFHRLRREETQAGAGDWVQRLSDYYAQYGSWQGVSSLLGGRGQSGRGGPPLRLADAEGWLVLDTVEDKVGQHLTSQELAQGEAIVVDGQQVGALLMGGYSATTLSQAERDFLARVQTTLIVSALLACLLALVLGFVLFGSIISPLRRLNQATAAVAEGDLSVQVPVAGQDEIGQLGAAFNHMTAALAQADRLRRDMTADIAHELRTPLTIIQGNLEAILDGVYPPDGEHLAPVLRKARLLNRLVEDLRTLALADAGELALSLTPMDLTSSVQRAAQDFTARAQAQGVELRCELPESVPHVQADALRIEQVLGILLDNALRHTPSGGQIVMGLRQMDGDVWVSISDTGEGAPPETLAHLFERFYRADKALSSSSGLGLAIAKAIVKAHGGRIWAESELGRGMCVTFVI